MVRTIKNTGILSLCSILTLYCILNSEKIAYLTKNGLEICLKSVLPSLFIYILLSKLMVGIIERIRCDNILFRLFSKILNLPCSLIPFTIFGFIFGSPASACAICGIYEKGLCTKNDAEKCIILTGCCSCSFIIVFCSSFIVNKSLTLIIFISNIMSCLTAYFLTVKNRHSDIINKTVKRSNTEILAFNRTLAASIRSTTVACLHLCGYVIFFHVFSALSADILTTACSFMMTNNKLTTFFRSVLISLFEITAGVVAANSFTGLERLVLINIAISFTGASLMMQISDTISDSGLSAKGLFLNKILCALISPVYTLTFIFVIPRNLLVFAHSSNTNNSGVTVFDIMFFIISSLLFFIFRKIYEFVDKKHKNNL